MRQPTPLTSSVGKASSFGQVMKDGFAFGVGSSIARTVVDSVLGLSSASSSAAAPVPSVKKTCPELEAEFNSCIRGQLPEHTCQDFLERYNQCKQ